MQEENENFKFPQQILNQIDECSNGAYALFRINQNNEIEQDIFGDDPCKITYLLDYMRVFLEAKDEIIKASIKQRFMIEEGEDLDEGFDEDPEEDLNI